MRADQASSPLNLSDEMYTVSALSGQPYFSHVNSRSGLSTWKSSFVLYVC